MTCELNGHAVRRHVIWSVSGVPVWVPHQPFSPRPPGAISRPLSLSSTAYVLVRIRNEIDSRYAWNHEESQDTAALAATWEITSLPAPSLLAAALLDDFLFPTAFPAAVNATPASVGRSSFFSLDCPFTVLKIERTTVCESHMVTTGNLAAHGSLGSGVVRADRKHSATRCYRLQLGTVLYASDWQFLVAEKRKEEFSATEDAFALLCRAPVLHPSQTQTEADMEALNTLFPAVHHGHYYATAKAFAQHCSNSDEHLIWCEEDPLLCVECGTKETEDGQAKPQGEEERSSAEITAATANGRCASAARKRRRRWLALHAHDDRASRCVRARYERPLLDERWEALTSIFCIYALDVRNTDVAHNTWGTSSAGSRGAAAAAEETSRQSGKATSITPASMSPGGIAFNSPHFAYWYSVLRPVCRLGLTFSGRHLADVSAAVASTHESIFNERCFSRFSQHLEAEYQDAIEEVLLHGISASLALWFAAQDSELLDEGQTDRSGASAFANPGSVAARTASVAESTELVTALVLDWWRQLQAKASTPDALPPLRDGAQPQRRQPTFLRPVAAHALDALQCYYDGEHADAAFAKQHPPNALAALCASCAAAITRVYRNREHSQAWKRVLPPHRRKVSEGSPPTTPDPVDVIRNSTASNASAPGFTPTISAESPAVPQLTRLGEAEKQPRSSAFQKCMNLVLHLLFADQQRQQPLPALSGRTSVAPDSFHQQLF